MGNRKSGAPENPVGCRPPLIYGLATPLLLSGTANVAFVAVAMALTASEPLLNGAVAGQCTYSFRDSGRQEPELSLRLRVPDHPH